jgi:hypothetical protein
MTNKQSVPFYVMNVFGQDRAVILNTSIRMCTPKETCSVKDLENIAKAFSIEFVQVPKPSSFPAKVGQVV